MDSFCVLRGDRLGADPQRVCFSMPSHTEEGRLLPECDWTTADLRKRDFAIPLQRSKLVPVWISYIQPRIRQENERFSVPTWHTFNLSAFISRFLWDRQWRRAETQFWCTYPSSTGRSLNVQRITGTGYPFMTHGNNTLSPTTFATATGPWRVSSFSSTPESATQECDCTNIVKYVEKIWQKEIPNSVNQ